MFDFTLCTHMIKKEPEKPILNQAATKSLSPVPQQKKRLYRRQERETENSRAVTTQVMKPEPSKTQENNPKNQQNYNKGTLNKYP
ncbi:unnamed protein product [Macrosiphum euphorbiae]|uniref:Uncharacterized protein n=1 Tax=Macrosiphum euphorbiae TaxID=13131 RepID=A0AAV0XUQ4_9HEMI|nr:unnamed protein product [Macrosiphum euphorbiae]